MTRFIRTGEAARRSRRSGLSLIELLTTVVIMGILATAALPLGEVVFIRDKEIELKRALFQTRQAIDRFYADNGVYPVNFEELRWYWKTNKPYLRQCPPVNPLAGSHDAWILVLKSNIPNDPNPSEVIPEDELGRKWYQINHEIPLTQKYMHAKYLLYGIYDIKVPDWRRNSSDPSDAMVLKLDTTSPVQIGYKFVDPDTGTAGYGPYYKTRGFSQVAPTDPNFDASEAEAYRKALDGTYYSDW